MVKKTSSRRPAPTTKATTYRHVADRYKVHVDTVRRTWTSASAGMPKLPATFKALDKWYEVYKKGNTNGKSAGGDQEVIAARREAQIAEAKIKTAKASIEVYKARQVLESMVPIEEVERFLADYFTEFRRQALRVSKDMKPGVPASYRKNFEKELDARIGSYLRSMKNYALSIAELRES